MGVPTVPSSVSKAGNSPESKPGSRGSQYIINKKAKKDMNKSKRTTTHQITPETQPLDSQEELPQAEYQSSRVKLHATYIDSTGDFLQDKLIINNTNLIAKKKAVITILGDYL